MLTCSYPGCGTTLTDTNLSFYLFPSDENSLRKWVHALGYDRSYKPSRDDYLCSKHFDPSDVVGSLLKPDAVPLRPGQNKRKSRELHNTNDIEEASEIDMCRICGKAKETTMTDIFDEDLDICEKIGLCLPIVINPNDNLPQTICEDCVDELDGAASLIKKCVAADEKLHRFFSKSNREKKKILKMLPLHGPIICDKCDVLFDDMALFDAHMTEHEEATKSKGEPPETPSIVCTSCGFIYPDWKTYEGHKAQVPSTCSQCGDISKSKCQSNVHSCVKYKCDYCGVIMQSDALIKNHIAKAHPGGGYKGLVKTENIEIEESENPDMLDIKPNLLPPRKHRNRKELYHCNICDIKFTTNKKLRDHCIEYHGTPNVLWICKFCGKSMTTKVSLQIHERIHFDSKPYICEWCGNGYRSRANLNQHQVIHTGVRNHECPKCGKRFSRKAFVRTHMRVHTGERPYVCDICGHRFTQLGDMKRHRNRHQNPHVPAYPSDRVYACDFCGQQFTQLSMLKKHRLQHAAENDQVEIIEETIEGGKEMMLEIQHVGEEEVITSMNHQ